MAFPSLSQAAVAVDGSRVGLDTLRVDGRTGPLYAFGNTTPSFSWTLDGATSQTAYEIRAATTEAGLTRPNLWKTNKVESSASAQVVWKGIALTSRTQVFWQVRVWDAAGDVSEWSAPQFFEMGLINKSDWGNAQWIEHPTRNPQGAMPIFAKQVTVDPAKTLAKARLYVSGLGVQVSTVNGKAVTDEVLAPGGANEQVAVPYRGYDVTGLLESGSGNTVGIELGNGEAFMQKTENPTYGRTDSYVKILGAAVVPTTLSDSTAVGATSVVVADVAGLKVGQTLNVDTADAGVRLEQRRITAIDAATRTVTLETALTAAHAAGAKVTRSGERDSPNTRVTPRLIARVELTYADGTTTNVVSDRTWRTATGPAITDHWWGGTDYDARFEQVGWKDRNSDLTSAATRRNGQATGWIDAGTVGTPNLDTDLIERGAEPVEIVDTFPAQKVWEVAGHPGTWIFDMGQAFSGFAEVTTPGSFPAGTTIKMQYGESFNTTEPANKGLINVLDMVEGSVGTTGTQTLDTYTTYGNPAGETWHPQFGYDGFQYIQMTGLPAGFTPTTSMIRGLQTHANAPEAGSVETDNERINRIHKMSHYSIMSNMQSYFTDCPNREKAGWLADMIQSMPAIDKHFDMAAYLHTMMEAIEGAQTKTGIDAGFVPSTTPNDQVRLSGSGLGNDLNWGGAVVLTPYWLFKNYGDQATMKKHWDSMVLYMDYIRTRRTAGTTGSNQYFIDNGLGDWASADRAATNRAMTATGAYFKMANNMAEMAAALGLDNKVEEYATLAKNVKATYNERFWNPALLKYTINPNSSVGGQTAQGIALDYGLVPDEHREDVLNELVEQIYAYNPNGGGPHLNSGMIGLGPVTRALMNNGRQDVLWDLLQEDTAPSYGYFLQDTEKHPGGLTTIPEYWDLRQSQNHMILLQIDEWFTAGLAGIKQSADSLGYKNLVIRPQVVGDLGHVKGEYKTPYGMVTSEWTREGDGVPTLKVSVPSNSTAEIWAPTGGSEALVTGGDATFVRSEDGYAVYEVGPGDYTFAPDPGLAESSVTAASATGTYGQATTVTAKVTGDNPTGTVDIASAGKVLATASVSNGTATAEIPATALAAGRHVLSLSYSGDAKNAASTSAATVTISKASTRISASVAPAKPKAGTRPKVKVVLTATGARPSGVVSVLKNGKKIASGRVNAAGKVVIRLPKQKAGRHKVRVVYNGSANFAKSVKVVTVRVVRRR
ncbi:MULTISPECIES: family 78 glycoside hydrolase catalytic domain [unclassified Nocardioides]|uniref:family 78 glycoside hydrolase catalytic domain n=1 Tax=unclassified Nocardioides TaxID=2615069 RepID=UPI0030155E27